MGALVHRRLFARRPLFIFSSSFKLKSYNDTPVNRLLEQTEGTSAAASFKTNLILLYLRSSVCDYKR